MQTLLTVLLALALDAVFGEPARGHPLVGFGRIATALEARLNRSGSPRGRLRGVLALLMLLTPPVLLAAWVGQRPGGWIADAAALYLAVGWRSLREHARAVAAPLSGNALPAARAAVARIVSRETADMDAGDIARAGVESVLENGNDAVFGAIFWCVLGGAPAVVLYRLANTLDAMWGYRSPRFLHFGWAAARFDDLLNLVPARVTALAYSLAGHTVTGLRCWRRQAPAWESPNAGPVMAAGAGSLGVQLGGAARYHGAIETRPLLGSGRPPQAGDIDGALRLVARAVLIWLIVIGVACVATS